MIDELRDNFLEFRTYSNRLDRHLYCEARDYYLELLDKVVTKKITTGEFFLQFYEKSPVNGQVLDLLESKLIILSPN